MKAITGNRLTDGCVVYFAPGDIWTSSLSGAVRLHDCEAENALAIARARVTEIADAYLINIEAGAVVGRETLRESIRAGGPSIWRDLGGAPEKSS